MIPKGRPGCEYGTAVYQTFGRHTPIQRCRVHKARNILERLSKPLHAAVRAVLRQAWGLDDADNRHSPDKVVILSALAPILV